MAEKEKRTTVLTLTEAEGTRIWIALDILESEYRTARRDFLAGHQSRFTSTIETAENGIRQTHNLKRRVTAARCRKPGSKSRG